jgi:hypothetical protein
LRKQEGFAMLVLLAAMALTIVLIYFISQQKQSEELWRHYLDRRSRKSHPPLPERPVDPAFNFDDTANSQREDDTHGPN